jgi:hypothetical protein
MRTALRARPGCHLPPEAGRASVLPSRTRRRHLPFFRGRARFGARMAHAPAPSGEPTPPYAEGGSSLARPTGAPSRAGRPLARCFARDTFTARGHAPGVWAGLWLKSGRRGERRRTDAALRPHPTRSASGLMVSGAGCPRYWRPNVAIIAAIVENGSLHPAATVINRWSR